MKHEHAKPLVEELMHISVLYHASPGMLRIKLHDLLNEFIPEMDDACFERGCPCIDNFAQTKKVSTKRKAKEKNA